MLKSQVKEATDSKNLDTSMKKELEYKTNALEA